MRTFKPLKPKSTVSLLDRVVTLRGKTTIMAGLGTVSVPSAQQVTSAREVLDGPHASALRPAHREALLRVAGYGDE